MADHTLAWLETVKSSRFFGWVHFYDAHSPYAPPEPYRTRIADPYLGEIAFVDSQVARIRAFLETEHLLDKTVVVVLGDHGESLGDHGERTHGFFVYDSVLHVPLMILAPYDALRGRRVADVVRSVDVLPTVMDLLGLPLTDRIEGQSVVKLMTGAVREMGLAGVRRGRLSAVPLRLERSAEPDLRPLQVHRGAAPGVVRPHPDPNETRNLYARAPVAWRSHGRDPRVGRCESRRRRQAGRRRRSRRPRATRRPRLRRHLRRHARSPTDRGSRIRKDKIELFNLVITARERIHDDHDSEGGLEALREVVSKDPQVIDAWLMMGNEYSRRHEFARAWNVFRKRSR